MSSYSSPFSLLHSTHTTLSSPSSIGASDQLPRRLPALLKDHHTHTQDDKGTCTLIPTSISKSNSNSNLCLSVNSSVGPSSFLRSVSDLSIDKGSYYNEYNNSNNNNDNNNSENNNSNNSSNNNHHYYNDDNSNHCNNSNNDNDIEYNSNRINNNSNNNNNGNNNENNKYNNNKIISCTSFDALTSTTYDTTSTSTPISTSTSTPSLSSLTQSNQKMTFFTKKFHDSVIGTDCPVELFPVKDTVYRNDTVQTRSGLMGMRAFKFASEKSKILKMK